MLHEIADRHRDRLGIEAAGFPKLENAWFKQRGHGLAAARTGAISAGRSTACGPCAGYPARGWH